MSRVRPVSTDLGPLKLSVYGRPKTGKTRLACSFPKPVLVVGTEDGTLSVDARGVDFVLLRECAELDDVLGAVPGGRWKTVVLDNGTGFRDIRLKEILGLDDVPVQKGYGFAPREAYMECANSLKQMFRGLLDLPRRAGVNVVFIAQEQNLTTDDGARGSDLITPVVGSALGKSVCDYVNAECDYICQTLIREETRVDVTDVNGTKVETKTPTGRKEYCLRVGPHEVYMTGFRVRPGVDLPDVIVDPSYEKIARLLRGGK